MTTKEFTKVPIDTSQDIMITIHEMAAHCGNMGDGMQPIVRRERLNDFIFEGRKPEQEVITVEGRSMVDAGIVPGDVLLFDSSLSPRNGDIVAFTIDGDSTVKKYYKNPRTGVVTLRPASEGYDAITLVESMDVRFEGVVTRKVTPIPRGKKSRICSLEELTIANVEHRKEASKSSMREAFEPYFVSAFRGIGKTANGVVNEDKLTKLCERLTWRKFSSREGAQVALMLYNAKIWIASKRPTSFTEWYKIFCNAVGIAKGRYFPSALQINMQLKKEFENII